MTFLSKFWHTNCQSCLISCLFSLSRKLSVLPLLRGPRSLDCSTYASCVSFPKGWEFKLPGMTKTSSDIKTVFFARGRGLWTALCVEPHDVDRRVLSFSFQLLLLLTQQDPQTTLARKTWRYLNLRTSCAVSYATSIFHFLLRSRPMTSSLLTDSETNKTFPVHFSTQSESPLVPRLEAKR